MGHGKRQSAKFGSWVKLCDFGILNLHMNLMGGKEKIPPKIFRVSLSKKDTVLSSLGQDLWAQGGRSWFYQERKKRSQGWMQRTEQEQLIKAKQRESLETGEGAGSRMSRCSEGLQILSFYWSFLATGVCLSLLPQVGIGEF